MKRKRDWSLILVLALCFSVLFGCGKADDAAKHSEQGELWEEEQDGQTAGEGGENVQRSLEEETDESLSDQLLPGDGLIRYTLENQPCELADGDTVLMYGNYYQVTLSDADRKAYPALQKHIEESNADEEKELVELLEQSEADALEMMNSGWGIAFEEFREFIPVRADENVFSYAMAYDSYYGGAHGFRNYQGFNLDAKTGEAISFSDVVKKTDGFSEVMYTELLAQNEELADYFGEFETDKEALFDSMAEMLADDAAGLKWALGYDGIRIYYQDYAMGSYAAGSQEEIIRFSDYPEYFTDTYVNYKENYPKIGDQVTVLEDAATVRLDSTGHVEINADDGDGEDWWYDIPIANPGWEPYVKDGIDTAAGKPSVRLTEISHETSDWLNEDVWARENGFTLPALLPYSDESYHYATREEDGYDSLFLNITDSNFSTVGGYNFSQFAEPPGADGDFAAYAEQGVRYAAIADGVLYVSIGHRTYASASPHTAYILAIDLDTNEVLWKSGDQVCNSNHFLIMKDSILCGYGFSAEPDYIYILNRRNGKTQEKIKVASAPYYFIPDEEELYVLTYNNAYRYRVSFDE